VSNQQPDSPWRKEAIPYIRIHSGFGARHPIAKTAPSEIRAVFPFRVPLFIGHPIIQMALSIIRVCPIEIGRKVSL
jgi:hypothetical protein